MNAFMPPLPRLFAVLTAFVLGVPADAGITYELRGQHTRGRTSSTVFADGTSYRVEARTIAEHDEFRRQYPIEISTDGGKTRLHLRAADQTWYEDRQERVGGTSAIGSNARVKQPRVTMTDEGASDEIPGLPARKLVLKASFVIETDAGSERLRLHKAKTVLLWVADIACAPPAVNALHRERFGYPEIDGAIERELQSIQGMIVRKVSSLSERYEGGAPRAFLSTTEVVDPKCVEVDPALFAIPKGYREQEPVIAGPGLSSRGGR